MGIPTTHINRGNFKAHVSFDQSGSLHQCHVELIVVLIPGVIGWLVVRDIDPRDKIEHGIRLIGHSLECGGIGGIQGV